MVLAAVLGEGVTVDRFVRAVNKFVEALNAENYAGIENVFGQKTLEAYPMEKTKPAYKLLLSTYGKVEKLDAPRMVSSNQAIFTVHFERVILDMQVTFDDEDKIESLCFLPNFDDHCAPAER
ncbi:DUF3887 domain-containing protein [candidate division KSB1 bacterium]|nr:DUF3887 domain-containing protein [candidate division KSB1 bacterium]